MRVWQRIVGVDVDGDFDAKTEDATKSWQKERELTEDGIVGKDTWWKAGHKVKNSEEPS